MNMNPLHAALAAGSLAGTVGLIVFLIIHHLWIKPIWMIFLPGLLIAILGGLALGWAYSHIRTSLPPRPWASLALFGLVTSILLPAMIVSFTHGPLFDLATANIRPGEGGRVAVRMALELALTAVVAGALVGHLVGHSSRAAFAMAVAGLVLAIGPGHNIPMFGANPVAFKGHAIVVAINAVSAVVLVESCAWFSKT